MKPRKLRHAIALTLMLGTSSLAFGQVTISVNLAPPELPVYDQPPIPGDGYVWTPGYWAWTDEEQGYYWVPGTWVEAPEPGYLWTPGYWAFSNGAYLWNGGYWGPHVGFYGGVNYGYGYGGRGYEGGYWRDGRMFYNRSVVNVGSTHITNVYNKTVINNVTVNRVSFNGGDRGVRATPSAADQQASRDRHVTETGSQRQHIDTARQDTALRASENHGRPAIAATAQPGHFTSNVVAARGAGAMSGPQRAAAPANAPHSAGGANQGAGPRVPENHAPDQSIRRNLERDQPQQGSKVAEPPARAVPQPQREIRSQSQPETRTAPAPRAETQPETRMTPAQRPAPQPRPEVREAPQARPEPPREAPQQNARPAAPAPEQRQQMHNPAPRPAAPEPRPQAQPRPQERSPEHG